MKCITLWQPWATLWVAGVKIHETRHWRTNVRGTVAVHASKLRAPEAIELCRAYRVFWRTLEELGFPTFFDLPFGQIVGTVDIVDCRLTEKVYPACSDNPYDWMPGELKDCYFGNYEHGRYAWRAENPVMLVEPVPWKGAQGFFEVPDDILNYRPLNLFAQEAG